ncbi:hypothetical protein ACQ4PT_031727 [Festuca glaucescens]
MVRKHGWQPPVHTFQIVAIFVFVLLVAAFYTFFAPFLGTQILKYVAIGIYTPVILGSCQSLTMVMSMHQKVMLACKAQICLGKLALLLEQTPPHLLVGALKMCVLTKEI